MCKTDDRRTADDKRRTWGFVVATDSFMSGWGNAQSRSLFAVPVKDHHQAEIVAANMRNRSEMKRVRIVGLFYFGTLIRPCHGGHINRQTQSFIKHLFYRRILPYFLNPVVGFLNNLAINIFFAQIHFSAQNYLLIKSK